MLTVIAIIRAVPGREAEIRPLLLGLVAPTRAEPGCRLYDLHADQADPALFIFVELWDDLAALERHRVAPHMQAHAAASVGLVELADVRLMHRIA